MGAPDCRCESNVSVPKTITADSTPATAIYAGDDARIAGVKVGTIAGIYTTGTQARLTRTSTTVFMNGWTWKAVIVAQNLISARDVQLAPAYQKGAAQWPMVRSSWNREMHCGSGRMGRGCRSESTRLELNWAQVSEAAPGTSATAGPIGHAGRRTDGNGEAARTITQLSGVGRILR